MGRWGLLPPGYRRSVMPTSPATDIRTAGLVPDRRSCYNNVLKMFQKRLTMPSAYVILFVSSENSRNFSGAKEPPYIRLSTSIPYVAQPLRERKSTMEKDAFLGSGIVVLSADSSFLRAGNFRNQGPCDRQRSIRYNDRRFARNRNARFLRLRRAGRTEVGLRLRCLHHPNGRRGAHALQEQSNSESGRNQSRQSPVYHSPENQKRPGMLCHLFRG